MSLAKSKSAHAFREIRVQGIPRALDRKAACQFNDRFNDDEISIVCNGQGVLVRLREVDMAKMRRAVREVVKECALPDNNILHATQKAIVAAGGYGIVNGRRNFVDYNKERKVVNRVAKEQQRGKLGYARTDFSQQENAVPARYENKIICGDSVDVLKKLPDNCADLVLTSPPYNFGMDYAKTADDDEWRTYFSKMFAVFAECIRVVKYGGRIVINVQPLYSDYMPSHHIIGNFFLRRGMIWRGEILWEKNNYNCKYTAWGSWKSPSNPYLKYSWEFLEVFCKGDLKKPGVKENADITSDEFKKWVYGKWSIAPERGMSEKYGHPAMFPEELARRVLKLFSFRGDLVIDPFNGAGTTTAVAKKTGRRFLGVDISREYCGTAKKRVDKVLL